MNLIWMLLRASSWNVAIAVLTGLISGGCSARLIALINTGISDGSSQGLVGAFIGLVGIALSTGIVSQFLLINLAQNSIYRLRLRLSQRILSAPLRQLEELGASRLLATLTEDVQAISNSIFVIPFMCVDIAIIVGCLTYLAWLSGTVFVATVVFLIAAITLVQFLLNKTWMFLALAREEDDQLYKHFRGLTEGIKELKLHSQRRMEFFDGELQVSAARSRRYRAQASRVGAIAISSGQLLYFVILGLVVFGLPQVIAITPSVLAAYVLTMTYLTVPIQNMMERSPTLLSANVALKKVEQMGLKLAQDAEAPSLQPSNPNSTWQALMLEHITHTYRGEKEDSRFVLGKLNLTLYSGQLIFIIGGNGSGKSTLAKLITGLYTPETGTISLDGIPVADHNREWYRQHFSVVFSDFYLFERLLGLVSPNLDRQAQHYLQQLQLDHKIQIRDGQLSSIALSQGQRKRLALLTAYLEDRSIYLFDEWASDQDPGFRAVFYEQLLPNLKARGKTVIVISHDDHYFHVADRVIKLDYGMIEYDKTIAP